MYLMNNIESRVRDCMRLTNSNVSFLCHEWHKPVQPLRGECGARARHGRLSERDDLMSALTGRAGPTAAAGFSSVIIILNNTEE